MNFLEVRACVLSNENCLLTCFFVKSSQETSLVSGQHIKCKALWVVPTLTRLGRVWLWGYNVSQCMKLQKRVAVSAFSSPQKWLQTPTQIPKSRKAHALPCLCLRHLLKAPCLPATAENSSAALGVWEMPVSLRLLNPIMLYFISSDQLT